MKKSKLAQMNDMELERRTNLGASTLLGWGFLTIITEDRPKHSTTKMDFYLSYTKRKKLIEFPILTFLINLY
jgi:hypothetical protein